ncbi:MAG: MFS transporter [Myxococcota bacterium]
MLTPRDRRVVTAALLVGTFLSSLEVSVVGAAMPTVVADLGGLALFPLSFSAYLLAQTVSTPAWGVVADRVGRRDTYVAGVLAFLAGSGVCALAPSMDVLVAGRVVQGVGAGAIMPLTMTLFGDLWPVDARARLTGLFSIVWGVSALIGPLVGGLITDAIGWRGIFWMNLAPGLAAGAVVAWAVPRALGQGGVGLAGDWTSLLKDPTQQAVNGVGLLLGAALYGFIGYLPVQVQGVRGGDALAAGLALLPLSIAWTVASNVAGSLMIRVGFRFLVRLGTAVAATGAAMTLVSPDWMPALIVYGAGNGLAIASLTVSAQEAAPQRLRGTATSIAMFSRSIGAAVGVQIYGLLAGFRPGAGSLAEVPDLGGGLARVFAAVVIAGGGAALVAFLRFPAPAKEQ